MIASLGIPCKSGSRNVRQSASEEVLTLIATNRIPGGHATHFNSFRYTIFDHSSMYVLVVAIRDQDLGHGEQQRFQQFGVEAMQDL